uniref:Variant surface glycoprotein 1125.4324 n=1 Tax=Trypanosoma brucei TaxID=5691 RepID=A0A1J0RAQ8_9TRYP|nr:variant surface glycoprotein 1125.4324 [Trypanosoma brucei]
MERMKETKAIVILSVLLMALSQCLANNNALGQAIWSKQCQLTKELRHVRGVAKAKLHTIVENVGKLTMLQLKLQIYAANKAAGDLAIATRAAALAAATRAIAEQRKIKPFVLKSLKATAHANDLAGAIASAMQMLYNAGGQTHYCVSDADKNGNGRAAARKAGCDVLNTNDLTAKQQLDDKVIDATGFKGMSKITATAGQGKANKCGFFKHQSSPNANEGLDVTTAGKGIHLAYGLITASVSLQPNAPDMQNLKVADQEEATAVQQKAYYYVPQIVQETAEALPEDQEQLLKTIISSSDGESALKETLATLQPGKKPSDFDANITKLKSEYFGDGGENATAMWNAVKATQFQSHKEDKKEKEQLQSVTSEEQLQQILNYYEVHNAVHLQRLAAEVEKLQANNKGKSKTTEELCNAIEDITTCNNNKQCSYDATESEENTKCKYNASKAEKSGVPETQTQTVEQTSTEKCTGKKKQEDCKDGCKWEGTE